MNGRCDAGLLIHEGQLFYESKGLHKVLDLGEWWYSRHGLPLPMGGNVIRRELGEPKVKEQRRRIVKTTGDGLLIEFASVVDAVR